MIMEVGSFEEEQTKIGKCSEEIESPNRMVHFGMSFRHFHVILYSWHGNSHNLFGSLNNLQYHFGK